MIVNMPIGRARRVWPLVAAHAAGQELRNPRIIGHESISLLTAVAAVKGDGDRTMILAEHSPHTARSLPSAQQVDVIRDVLHGTCIPVALLLVLGSLSVGRSTLVDQDRGIHE
jgi:hypothetical protein